MGTTGKIKALLGRFRQDEAGSATVETVIWLPIFVFMFAVVVNVTMVFFQESQMLRVVQDANRALSTGHFVDEQETETFVTTQVAYLTDRAMVSTQIDDGIIETRLSIPAVDLMPMTLTADRFFSGTDIVVVAQHYVEF